MLPSPQRGCSAPLSLYKTLNPWTKWKLLWLQKFGKLRANIATVDFLVHPTQEKHVPPDTAGSSD